MELQTSNVRSKSAGWLTALAFIVVTVVALVAAYLSWGHIQEVAAKYGEPGSYWLPITVDGMMLSGTVLGAVDSLRGYRTRGWSVASLWSGSLMSMAFNMVSALARGPVAMGIASIPAVCLIFSVEALFHPGRKLRETFKQKMERFVEHTKETESAPEPKPETRPTKAAPAKQSPQGVRGRKAQDDGGKETVKPQGPQRPHYRPKPQGQTRPERKPVEAVAVVPSSRPAPVATEQVEKETADVTA